MNAQPLKIATIILNYKGTRDTLNCAKSLLASEEQPWLMVIVDNHSEDESLQSLRNWANDCGGVPHAEFEAGSVVQAAEKAQACCNNHACDSSILLISSQHNRGYAAGNNLGIAAALALGADACWILNNDTLVDRHALGAMRQKIQECPQNNYGLVGSLILYDDNFVQCCAGGFTNIWGVSRQVGSGLRLEQARALSPADVEAGLNYIYGASVLATREFLESVGFMEEAFFLYCEEQDWAWRGIAQGFSLGYAPRALVVHKEGATTGMNAKHRPPKRLMQLTRSRLLLAWKHNPLACITVSIGCGFALLRILWRRFFSRPTC